MYTRALHVVNRRLYGIYINVWFTNNLWKTIWLLDSTSFTSLCQALLCAIPNSCPPLTWRQLLLGGSGKHTRVELTPPAAVIWRVLCLKKGAAWQLLLCRQASMWWQVVRHCRDQAQVQLSGEKESHRYMKGGPNFSAAERFGETWRFTPAGRCSLLYEFWFSEVKIISQRGSLKEFK